MKPLPPSMREKKRYLKFKIHSEEPIEFGELVDEIWDSALDYMGSKHTGEANHWIIKNQYSVEEQKGIIKIRRSYLEDFRSALTLIDSIGDQKAFIEVEKISGSIKKLKKN